jgi:hypothetical protein
VRIPKKEGHQRRKDIKEGRISRKDEYQGGKDGRRDRRKKGRKKDQKEGGLEDRKDGRTK